MVTRHSRLLTLLLALTSLAPFQSGGAASNTAGQNQIFRSQAASVLANRSDANSLLTAAALRFSSAAGKPKVKSNAQDPQKSAADLIAQAAALAPQSAAIAWMHLQICAETALCNTPEVATVMRWIDADNSASWMPILATAHTDKDVVEIDRVLDDMAHAPRFDLYLNRLTVVMFDVLKTQRHALPIEYADSDWARFTEVNSIATADAVPSFSALADVCRDIARALNEGTASAVAMLFTSVKRAQSESAYSMGKAWR